MILFRSTAVRHDFRAQPEAIGFQVDDLICRLQALQEEKNELQQLVCHLLQQDELLRLEISRSIPGF
jgi:hypothetical protein